MGTFTEEILNEKPHFLGCGSLICRHPRVQAYTKLIMVNCEISNLTDGRTFFSH